MKALSQTDCCKSPENYDYNNGGYRKGTVLIKGLSLSEKNEVKCASNCAAIACTIILLLASLAILGAAAIFLSTPIGLSLFCAGIVLMTIAVISAITLAIIMYKEKNQLSQQSHYSGKPTPASSYHSLPNSINCPYCRNEVKSLSPSAKDGTSYCSSSVLEWDTIDSAGTIEEPVTEPIYDTPYSPVYANIP